MKIEFYSYKELNFVEFNITGSSNEYNKCDEESFYIDSVVFNIFTECFEKASKLYEYFGPTRYNSRNIVPLKNALSANLVKLNNIKDKKQFKEYISSIFLGDEFLKELKKTDSSWEEKWDVIHKKLVETNKKMIEITDRCIDEERILWVVGY